MVKPFPGRPEHPDFWRMVEVIRDLDERMASASATNEDERDEAFMAVVDEHCDRDSLLYMASQRAMRLPGVLTKGTASERIEQLTWLTTVYVESFIAGMDYQKRLS